MKQVLQSLRTGQTTVAEVPTPACGKGKVLIRSRRTLLSAGTERMLLDFGKANWLDRARQHPDRVREVVDKVRNDGVGATLDAVQRKLDTPLPMGYCNVGTVLEVGEGVEGFSVGYRVLSNGHHAEIVAVPQNLCCRIPDEVDDDAAVFGVVGAIALQGTRLLTPTIGESVVVIELGLVGLMAVQVLKANGCRVLGLDFDQQRVELAKNLGAESVLLAPGVDAVAAAQEFSRNRGVDGALIAAATDSDEPVEQAAAMCRKRGRIVLVGVVGLQLSRAAFYEKELSFQVSCSYGPGRYDPQYEDKGHDYPYAYVRWTEQRNFEAVLDLMAAGRLDVAPLISNSYPIAQAPEAYATLGRSAAIGILLEYPQPQTGDAPPERTLSLTTGSTQSQDQVSIGFIGAGNYAAGVLVPAFADTGARLRSIASMTGVSSAHLGRKHNIETATTDASSLLDDPEINALVIATRHDSHAQWVQSGLQAGKHVFVEKPLALTLQELEAIRQTCASLGEQAPRLMVGFNRRYAPFVRQLKQALAGATTPAAMIMTVNAGAIPANHWTQDPDVGGGRLIGEGCHFVDLLRFLADAPIDDYKVSGMRGENPADTWTLQLNFANGSQGSIHYLANGNKRYPKERLEVFSQGRIARIDNFRRIESIGWPGLASRRSLRQDKGQPNCTQAFVDSLRAGVAKPLIPLDELLEVAELCIRAAADLKEK